MQVGAVAPASIAKVSTDGSQNNSAAHEKTGETNLVTHQLTSHEDEMLSRRLLHSWRPLKPILQAEALAANPNSAASPDQIGS